MYVCMYYEINHILLIVMQMDEKEGKQKITSPKRLRDPTLKPEIAKKRSEGLKIDIQYNDDGEGVGEGYVQLVSYTGVLA